MVRFGLEIASELALRHCTRRYGQISAAALSKLCHELDLGMTPHGLRSSFRDWCAETGVARELAEACLAHVIANSVEAAYRRSDLLEQRRSVMAEWSNFITHMLARRLGALDGAEASQGARPVGRPTPATNVRELEPQLGRAGSGSDTKRLD